MATALGAYSAGSTIVALVLPGVLDKVPDRAVMLHGALLTAVILPGLAVITAAGAGAWRRPALLAV